MILKMRAICKILYPRHLFGIVSPFLYRTIFRGSSVVERSAVAQSSPSGGIIYGVYHVCPNQKTREPTLIVQYTFAKLLQKDGNVSAQWPVNTVAVNASYADTTNRDVRSVSIILIPKRRTLVFLTKDLHDHGKRFAKNSINVSSCAQIATWKCTTALRSSLE